MIRPILLTAVLTGVFCSVFAVGIDYVVDMLERGTVIVVSFLSGFLGSLTTFSTYSLETLAMLREGRIGHALAYAVGSMLLGAFAAWLGWQLVHRP